MATTASAPSRARRNAVAPPMPPAGRCSNYRNLTLQAPRARVQRLIIRPYPSLPFLFDVWIVTRLEPAALVPAQCGSSPATAKDRSGSGFPTQGSASCHRNSKLFDRELACHLSTECIGRLDRIIVFLAVLELPANEIEAHHVAVSVDFPVGHCQVAPPLDKDA
jgi:hypothetical protein